MKKIVTLLLCSLPFIVFASDRRINNDVKNDNESAKISLYIPGFLMEAGSWFVKKDDDPELKSALKKLRSTSIVVREGTAYTAYNSSGKFERKIHRLKKQHFEEIITAMDDDQKVTIQIRQNKKDKIRQVVVLADDGATQFVFLRMRCNISVSDLKNWMNKQSFSKENLNDIIKV